jgi:hypothetical protein
LRANACTHSGIPCVPLYGKAVGIRVGVLNDGVRAKA